MNRNYSNLKHTFDEDISSRYQDPYISPETIKEDKLDKLEKIILNIDSYNKTFTKYIIAILLCIAILLIPIGAAVYFSYENNVKTWVRWAFAYPSYIILSLALYAIIMILEYKLKNISEKNIELMRN